MLCTFPLAKPVVSIWFTPLGPAPLSLRLFAWSFQVYTLCCLIVIVYQSRSLRLKPTPKVPKEQGVILVTSIMLRSMQDSWYYGVPTMLLRSLKLIGKASRSAQATCRTGLLANIGRGWCRPTGNLSPKCSRTDGMTGT